MKKKAFFLLLLLLIPLPSILSQEIALRTNALSWATTTINLGAEFKINGWFLSSTGNQILVLHPFL